MNKHKLMDKVSVIPMSIHLYFRNHGPESTKRGTISLTVEKTYSERGEERKTEETFFLACLM